MFILVLREGEGREGEAKGQGQGTGVEIKPIRCVSDQYGSFCFNKHQYSS